jgi:hypothetical protein
MKYFLIIFLVSTSIFASESELVSTMKIGCEKQKSAIGCYNYANFLIKQGDNNLADKYFDKGCKLGNKSSCRKEVWEFSREPASIEGEHKSFHQGENKNAKYRDIRKLFKIQKTEEMTKQMIGQLIQAIAEKVPADKKQQFAEIIKNEVNFSELTELMIPIYDRHFTHVEIKEILFFYETPSGEKLITSQPKIMQDSIGAIQQWSNKSFAKIDELLKPEQRMPSSTKNDQ